MPAWNKVTFVHDHVKFTIALRFLQHTQTWFIDLQKPETKTNWKTKLCLFVHILATMRVFLLFFLLHFSSSSHFLIDTENNHTFVITILKNSKSIKSFEKFKSKNNISFEWSLSSGKASYSPKELGYKDTINPQQDQPLPPENRENGMKLCHAAYLTHYCLTNRRRIF